MSLDDCLGGKQLARQRLLLNLKLVDVECIGEVGLLELGATSVQLVDTTLLQTDFTPSGLTMRCERLDDGRPEAPRFRSANAESLEVAQHRVLDALHANVSLTATCGVELSSEAVEVGVSTAVSTGGDYHPHPGSASGAVQHRLQGMWVLLRFVLSAAAAGQNVLDGLEGDGVDEGLMPTWMFDTSKSDETCVVPVPEHAVSLGETDWTLGVAVRGSLRQPPAVKVLAEAGDGVVPFGELRERPAHMVGPIRVGNDDADVFAIHPVARVEIANRRHPRRAPEFSLLLHALLGFEGQVAGVELGDRRHDPVQQRAGRRFVDILGGGDELGVGLADGEDDLDVVGPIASQAINLVHDDEIDVLLIRQPA